MNVATSREATLTRGRIAIVIGDFLALAGIAFCIPFAIMAIGAPIALCLRFLLWLVGMR